MVNDYRDITTTMPNGSEHRLHCGAVRMGSIGSQILTKYALWCARYFNLRLSYDPVSAVPYIRQNVAMALCCS